MFESGFTDYFFLSFDAFVEGIQRLPFFENAVEIPFPFRTFCFRCTVLGNKRIASAVVEIKKEKTVEQPVPLSVGKRVSDIRDELIFRPVDAFCSSLIDKGGAKRIDWTEDQFVQSMRFAPP